jgi:hypothetical protein
MPKRSSPRTTRVESIRHKDKRANIPTEELRDFMADEEHAPEWMLYPRGYPKTMYRLIIRHVTTHGRGAGLDL